MRDKNAAPTPEEIRDWWTTEIIDIEPDKIHVRGYPIQELIGRVSFAEMIWLMHRGEMPSKAQARLLECALVAAVDHGPQAPSISIARMSMTCGVGINNAIASGINALGDVHGGAGQQCMQVFYDLHRRAQEKGRSLQAEAQAYIADTLASRKPLPGFGHRFHQVDPRAVRLQELLASAPAGEIGGQFRELAAALEAALSAAKGRRIPLNIDGALAAVLCELGFDPILGRGLFVLSRAVGISAHAYEQHKQGGRIKGPTPPQVGYRYAGAGMRSNRS